MAQEPTPTGAGLVYGGTPGTGAATVVESPDPGRDLGNLYRLKQQEETARKAARASVGKHMSEIEADGWWRHDEETNKRMGGLQGKMTDDYGAYGKDAYTGDDPESVARRQSLYKEKSDVQQYLNKSRQIKAEWEDQNNYLLKNLDNVTPESRERHYEYAKLGYEGQEKAGFPRLELIEDPYDYMENLNKQKLPDPDAFPIGGTDKAGRTYTAIQKRPPDAQLRTQANNWVDAGASGSNPGAEQLVADQLALLDRDPTTKILPQEKREEMANENAKKFVFEQFKSRYPSGETGPRKYAPGEGKKISKEPPTAGFYQEDSGEGVTVLQKETGEEFKVKTGASMVFNPGGQKVKIKPTGKLTAKGEPISDKEDVTGFNFVRVELVPTAKKASQKGKFLETVAKGAKKYLTPEGKTVAGISQAEWIPEEELGNLKEGTDYEMVPYAMGEETYVTEDFVKPTGMDAEEFNIKIEEGDTEGLPTKQVEKVRTVYFPEKQNSAALKNKYKDYRLWDEKGAVFGETTEGGDKQPEGEELIW